MSSRVWNFRLFAVFTLCASPRVCTGTKERNRVCVWVRERERRECLCLCEREREGGRKYHTLLRIVVIMLAVSDSNDSSSFLENRMRDWQCSSATPSTPLSLSLSLSRPSSLPPKIQICEMCGAGFCHKWRRLCCYVIMRKNFMWKVFFFHSHSILFNLTSLYQAYNRRKPVLILRKMSALVTLRRTAAATVVCTSRLTD